MKIVIASDHAGFKYKTQLLEGIRAEGHEVTDLGAGVFVGVGVFGQQSGSLLDEGFDVPVPEGIGPAFPIGVEAL